MSKDPDDFRNPKVSNTDNGSSGGMGKWIGIAIAVILALLLLGWLFGLFADDEVDTTVVPADDDAVVVTD